MYKYVEPTPDLPSLFASYCGHRPFIFLLCDLYVCGIGCLRISICPFQDFFSVEIMFIHFYKLNAVFSIFFENMIGHYVYNYFI